MHYINMKKGIKCVLGF